MFPNYLDNAKVLLYTDKHNFGAVFYTTGEVFDYIEHLAICQYPNSTNEYYLFGVNSNYEVISDTLHDSKAACVQDAERLYGSDIVFIESDE